ncbi:MAG: universal stress protein [Deltaproteobacteria bacterium]|nr:universal stress protein [Deltaproteobacteria bacterium]
MKIFKHIGFCTDFSDGSDYAFASAAELAKKFEASLHLIHVIPPIVAPSLVLKEFIEDKSNLVAAEEIMRMSEEKIGEIYLSRFGEDEIFYEIHILSGHPATEIINLVKEKDIDVLVMGSHGLTGLAYVFFGSTAEKVVRRAPCSVLVVRKRS